MGLEAGKDHGWMLARVASINGRRNNGGGRRFARPEEYDEMGPPEENRVGYSDWQSFNRMFQDGSAGESSYRPSPLEDGPSVNHRYFGRYWRN